MSNRFVLSVTPSEEPSAGKTVSNAIEKLIHEPGLTLDDIAGALSVDRDSVEEWRTGRAVPRQEAYQRLAALIELRQRLHEFFKTPQDGADWLHDASRYLGWATPVDVIRAGHVDRARAALEVLASGMFI